MKKIFFFTLSGIVAIAFAQTPNQSNKTNMSVNLQNEKDALSYYLGRDVGNNLKALDIPNFNEKTFMQGINEVMQAKQEDTVKDSEGRKMIAEFFQKKQQEAIEKQQIMNKRFFEENAKKPGVITTPSGLQYEILVKGNGAKPTLQNKVKCMYKGSLLNGQVFDQSKQPVEFPLNGVIQGWQEGLQLMNVSSKFRFYIPAELGYGEKGAGNSIPPYSALVFEVELLGVE